MTMRVVCVGECMVEFLRRDDGLWQQGFAGDTLNVAWAVRALLPASAGVDYLTRLGSDGLSDRLMEFLAQAGIGRGAITHDPARTLGLYTIETDSQGERQFSYWRSASAARLLADDPATLASGFEAADLIYLSGITLAILSPDRRAALLDALGARGAGRRARVAFDPNIRPRLWESIAATRAAITAAAGVADILLPTHDDEAAAFGDSDAVATRARYAALGVEEVVVKDGTRPTLVAAQGQDSAFALHQAVRPVDTTGAGDSFNGAYLAARLQGKAIAEAVAQAQAVSRAVVGQRGALIPSASIRAAAAAP
jgi:2-dehydro-3-deoxygluconokinase